MTPAEKKIFRFVIFGSLALGAGTITSGVWLKSNAIITVGSFTVLFGLMFVLFWVFQCCMGSFKEYGLGEGIANLYGEERAKMMFGEDYKRPESRDD